MMLFQKFQIIQLLVIVLTSIVGGVSLFGKKCPERKYILLLLALDIPVMAIIVYHYINDIDSRLLWFSTIFYSWCEIFLIPLYISEVTSIKKDYITPSVLAISSPILSIKLLHSLHELPYLLTNIYISYYIFKYFRWIFNYDKQLDLLKTSHFWIILGILLCYTTSIPYFITDLIIYTWARKDFHTNVDLNLFIIFLILHMIMTLLFTKGFSLARNNN
jgi:hypothetical protein